MIILVAQLPSVLCRALNEGDNTSKQINVYENLSDDSHGLLTSSYRRGSSIDAHEKEDADSSRENVFESQRKFLPHSFNEPDANNKENSSNNNSSENVNSLEVIKRFIENNDDSRLNGNSSMIVHVIVTSSSSSTSSGSIELDETDNHSSNNNEDTFQYTVSEDEGDGNLVAAPSSESQISAVNPSTTFQREPEDRVEKQSVEDDRGNFSPQKSQFSYAHPSQFSHHDDNLELKRLPTPENPAQDIFSAFYRAFSQSSESTPTPTTKSLPQISLSEVQSDQPSIFPDRKEPVETITTFRFPSRPDFRQRPSSIQLFQQRRRLLRNRQMMERKSLNLSLPTPVPTGTIAAEETARKLEFLARKLDTSELEQSFRGGQHDKILVVSSSSSPLITTTTQTPFLLPQNSRRTQSITPSKIAVSVTHTKSVVAPPATTVTKKTEVEPASAVVREEVRKNVRSHPTLPHALSKLETERENIHNTYSTFVQSRPLVKSLPRNQDGDHEDDHINNKNRSNKHNFPKNFSTYDLQQENAGGLRKSYESASSSTNGDERNISEKSSSNNHNDEVNATNFQIHDRHNIISRSEDGRDEKFSVNLPGRTSGFAIPNAEIPSVRTHGHRRKITRTVSDQIGNPSSFFFNFNVDFESTPRTKPKIPVVAKQTQLSPIPKPTPKPVNWQQPERIWGEPAQVWGSPAKIWSEPERIWSEPARVWSQPEKVWNDRKLEEEMMQSDQPPEERKNDEPSSDGTFVILGDDETEGDSIDGDLGRPLMLHHFTVPPNKQKETVSVSTSVSSSISKNQHSSNKSTSIFSINGSSTFETVPFSRKVAEPSTLQETHPSNHHRQPQQQYDTSSNLSNFNSSTSDSTNSDTDQHTQSKKSGKKFGYVIEGANVRKYRVEERTSDGYIVGEYGVLNNQNAFLRGVRYTADGTINPRLIHEALMKFLSLRRR